MIAIALIIALVALIYTISRLMAARADIWDAKIKDYSSFYLDSDERSRKLNVTHINSTWIPVIGKLVWRGNATDQVDVSVNFFTGRVKFRWKTGKKVTEALRGIGSSTLYEIERTLVRGESADEFSY